MIYDERMRMVLYNYVPNEQSKKDVVRAMKENLGLVEHKVIKEFSFSINEPYEKEVIGYGPYKSGSAYTLLPDFTGDSEAQARATASRLGINVTFVGGNGYVIDQEYPAGKRIDKIRGSVTLTLGGSQTSEEEEEEDGPSNITTPPIEDDDDKEEETPPKCGEDQVLQDRICVPKEPEITPPANEETTG